jgi:nuclear mRNA export protein SAC3
MDDPLVPKRLDEAITMVGTCMDMCPRFERYRRERENNLFNWEVVRIRLVFLSSRETHS